MLKCEKCGIEYPSEIDFHQAGAGGPLICIRCHKTSGGSQEGDPTDSGAVPGTTATRKKRPRRWFRAAALILFSIVIIVFVVDVIVNARGTDTAFLGETESRNAYGQITEQVLTNDQDVMIARREYVYDRGRLFGSDTYVGDGADPVFGTYLGNPTGPSSQMYLCFNSKGKAVTRGRLWWRRPVIVEAFQAIQPGEAANQYSRFNPQQVVGRIATHYPCQNCAEVTGHRDCTFVW